MLRVYIFILCILLLNFSSKAQDSVKELKIVEITAERLESFSIGLNNEGLDSTFLSKFKGENLGSILTFKGLTYVKSYGAGGLADISIRGTSARQNAVFWNGFNINAVNVGQTDYSLIPSSFFNKINILYGGNSSTFGNGIIGGSVHLENEANYRKHWNIDLNSSIGSFNYISESIKSEYSNGIIFTMTGFEYSKSKNDFPYKNIVEYGFPEEKQKNAETESYGFIQKVSFLIKKYSSMDIAVWYENHRKNIPASMTELSSNANQKDENLRSSLRWIYQKNDLSVKASAGYFHNYLYYENANVSVYSRFITDNIAGQVTLNKDFRILKKKFKLDAGMNSVLNSADIDAYKGKKNQNQAGFFASILHISDKNNWKYCLNMRQEIVSDYRVPLTPSIGAEGKVWKNISAKINLSRNFRTPTLNDRYWQPGGNRDLKPELSYNGEAGIIYKRENWETGVTYFNSVINNWIQWIPMNSGLWMPENVKKVYSRGVEVRLKKEYRKERWSSNIYADYSYVKSTIISKSSNTDESRGKQLIYTPEHIANAGIEVNLRKIKLFYNQNITGRRYVTSDNSKFIEAYSIANLQLGYQLNRMISVKTSVNNLYNTSYQAIEFMPMPGRYYRLTINFNFYKS